MSEQDNSSNDSFFNLMYIEALAKTFYNLTQEESKKQGREYSTMAFEEVDDASKEYYRIFAKYILNKLTNLVEALEFYADEKNWSTLIESENETPLSLKDGIIYDDAGEKARAILKQLGFIE